MENDTITMTRADALSMRLTIAALVQMSGGYVVVSKHRLENMNVKDIEYLIDPQTRDLILRTNP